MSYAEYEMKVVQWGEARGIVQNEIQNVKIQNLASDPSSPVAGQIWYNTTSGKLVWRNGTTTIDPTARANHSDAGQKAMRQLMTMANSSGAHLAEAAHLEGSEGLEYLAVQMSNSKPPTSIEYRLDGKFHRVLKRSWA